MKQKVYITGFKGFIGGHLAGTIAARENWHVAGIVDLDDIPPDANVIVHLAAKASVPQSIDNPYETFMTNVVGTLKVLEACRRSGAKLVFASSSQAQANALSPYGLQKYECEELIRMYARLYGIKYCILRLYSVFGEGDHSVISAFMRAAEQGKPLEVWGGDQLRDFVHIDAVVDKFIYGIRAEGTYDVGSGVRWKVSQIADMISENQIRRELKPYERMEARCLNPVNSIPVEEYILSWQQSK